MKTIKVIRKPLPPIDAVQVTVENMDELSKWAEGEIRSEGRRGNQHIFIETSNPISDRQKKAYATDWILYSGKGFKIYPDKQFRKTFEFVDEDLLTSPASEVQNKPTVTHKDNRDAVTGQFTTKEYAESHPDTTVEEENAPKIHISSDQA